MSIGALRRRLVLEEPLRISDGAGGGVRNWVSVATLWGAIKSRNGTEAVVAGRLSGAVSHEITIRYRDDVKPTMRFRLGVQLFEILAVLYPTDQKRWIKCLCQERDL